MAGEEEGDMFGRAVFAGKLSAALLEFLRLRRL